MPSYSCRDFLPSRVSTDYGGDWNALDEPVISDPERFRFTFSNADDDECAVTIFGRETDYVVDALDLARERAEECFRDLGLACDDLQEI